MDTPKKIRMIQQQKSALFFSDGWMELHALQNADDASTALMKTMSMTPGRSGGLALVGVLGGLYLLYLHLALNNSSSLLFSSHAPPSPPSPLTLRSLNHPPPALEALPCDWNPELHANSGSVKNQTNNTTSDGNRMWKAVRLVCGGVNGGSISYIMVPKGMLQCIIIIIIKL